MGDLREQIRSCTKCELYSKLPCGTKPIPGTGPTNAKLFIIGESSGKDESIMETQFVGLCGKFLTKCLNDVGIDRDKCFIANCLRCRPTDTGKKNRPPTEQEYIKCIDWVYQELELVKPNAILGLGGFAARALFGSKIKSISGIAGMESYYRLFDLRVPFICTYHPSYIQNRNIGLMNTFLEHLTLVRKLAYGE